MSIAAPGRRSDGNENGVGGADRGGQIGGERQAPAANALFDVGVQFRLVNGNLAPVEAVNFIRILVDADHFGPEFGKTCARNQAHIAGANHCYLHR